MKNLLITFLFFIFLQVAKGQVTDTVPPPEATDTFFRPADRIPVLSDTTQYNDTVRRKTAAGDDTLIVKKRVHSPRTATLRSAIIPGWGQVYNKKYWKVPIVYAGIGVPAYLFFDNKNWYNRTRYALAVVTTGAKGDSLERVHPQLRPLVDNNLENSLVRYRNEFRRDMDYSILFTLLMWGLNVVDATVDAHLKGFDVGDELSFRFRPVLMPATLGPGISLVVSFK